MSWTPSDPEAWKDGTEYEHTEGWRGPQEETELGAEVQRFRDEMERFGGAMENMAKAWTGFVEALLRLEEENPGILTEDG